jgi:hypothetical protein
MFSYLNSAFGPNLRRGLAGLPRGRGLCGPVVHGRAPRSEAESDLLSRVRPDSVGFDLIGDSLDPNSLSYPLRRSVKLILSRIRFLLNLHEIEFDSNSESVRVLADYDPT